MTTTQTRTAAAAIITLIIAGVLIATPAGSYLVHDILAPVFDSLGVMLSWMFDETIGSFLYTVSGLFDEFGELWSSIFG